MSVRERPVLLTYREYAVLVYLATHAGYVVTTRRLLEEGLGRHDPWGIRTVEEIIQSLKSRLETDGRRFLEDVPGEGYRFIPPPVASAESGSSRVQDVASGEATGGGIIPQVTSI